MKIYDITQPLFECAVFPGDPHPEKREVRRMEKGDVCNLTALTMCAHNGTHVDAPFHFYKDGKGVDGIALEKCVGPAYVASHDGEVTAADAEKLLAKARTARPEAAKKLLLRGSAVMTTEGAEVLAREGIDLIGVEPQSVGPEKAPMAVHLVLLKKEIVILEGIRLKDVEDGVYMLYCAPLNLTATDGAPCRAILTELA